MSRPLYSQPETVITNKTSAVGIACLGFAQLLRSVRGCSSGTTGGGGDRGASRIPQGWELPTQHTTLPLGYPAAAGWC